MNRPLAFAFVGALIGAMVVLVAIAVQASTVEVPIGTHRGDPGDLILLGEAPAPAGQECVAELEARNPDSIHPNNDILVGPIVFPDIEDGTFQAAGLSFISDGVNLVFLRLGEDAVFSAGFILEVTCNPPTTTTTTTPAESSTTTTFAPPSGGPTSTTAPPVTTTTLSPPPVGGVETGGGACADGICESLSPLLTWLLLGVLFAAGAGLVWAYFSYMTGDTDE